MRRCTLRCFSLFAAAGCALGLLGPAHAQAPAQAKHESTAQATDVAIAPDQADQQPRLVDVSTWEHVASVDLPARSTIVTDVFGPDGQSAWVSASVYTDPAATQDAHVLVFTVQLFSTEAGKEQPDTSHAEALRTDDPTAAYQALLELAADDAAMLEPQAARGVFNSCLGCANTRPRPGYRPVPNGCTSSPDSPWIPLCGSVSFKSSCNAHDICYGTCNSNRERCDSIFLSNLQSACRSRFGSGACRSACSVVANVYHRAVRLAGARNFCQGQRNACVCVGGTPQN